MAAYRILSLDGGGIRGLVTVIVLQRILSERPRLLEDTHLLAGTSTGGLIALGLASGATLASLRQLYETKGEEIFDDGWIDDVVDLGKTVGADYDNQKLIRHVRELLGEKRLRHLEKQVMVTAFDLDNEDPAKSKRTWKPKVFHNLPGDDKDGEVLAWKAGIYTSAAPTYFPSFEGYVDGGVYANNPSMCALALTLDERNATPHRLVDLRLVSLGTGNSLTYVKGQSLDWGLAQWVKPLIGLMMDGVSGIAHFQCQQLLGPRYHRLAPDFAPGVNIPLDAVERVGELAAFAGALDLSATLDWLDVNWA
jgi:patatin-like phospholipase/acyl hydrolase